MPNYIRSQAIDIPANTSFWGNIGVSGGNILSIAMGNDGFVSQCYATQLFANSNSNIFFQFDNLNSSDVSIFLYAVTDAAAAFGSLSGTGSQPVS